MESITEVLNTLTELYNSVFKDVDKVNLEFLEINKLVFILNNAIDIQLRKSEPIPSTHTHTHEGVTPRFIWSYTSNHDMLRSFPPYYYLIWEILPSGDAKMVFKGMLHQLKDKFIPFIFSMLGLVLDSKHIKMSSQREDYPNPS